MSEPKFTKGPWKRHLYDHGGSRIYAGENDNELIADTYDPRGNADLIFAAPEMYEALQKVTQSAEWDYMESDVQEAVSAALSKAAQP